jgi:hypothetical protein
MNEKEVELLLSKHGDWLQEGNGEHASKMGHLEIDLGSFSFMTLFRFSGGPFLDPPKV